jgi:hypothetical protein
LFFELRKSSPTKEILSMAFDAEFAWRENFGKKNSSELRVLNESFAKYFNDLLRKYGPDKASVLIQGLKVTPADFSTLTHFELIAECENKANIAIRGGTEGQSGATVIASRLSFHDLMIYFQEVGHTEEVNTEALTASDKNFRELEFPPKSNFSDQNRNPTQEKFDYAEELPDEYNESNYDLNDFDEAAETPQDESDLFVLYVERLASNEFMIEASLPYVFIDTGTQHFKEKFETYVQENYALNPLYNDSKIIVNLINSTETEDMKETIVWLNLQTVNIDVFDEDFNLEDSESIFDDIFDFFYVYEFDGNLSTAENENETRIEDATLTLAVDNLEDSQYETKMIPESSIVLETPRPRAQPNCTEQNASSDGM